MNMDFLDKDPVVSACRAQAARIEKIERDALERGKARALADVLGVSLKDELAEVTQEDEKRRGADQLKRRCEPFFSFAKKYGMSPVPATDELIASFVLSRFLELFSKRGVEREISAVSELHVMAGHHRPGGPFTRAALLHIEKSARAHQRAEQILNNASPEERRAALEEARKHV
jgi:hypothetical protein